MESTEQKISTSVQYMYTNMKLLDEIFFDWPNFHVVLKQGPQAMKQHLLEGWNQTKAQLAQNASLEVADLNNEVTPDDFDVTVNKTKRGSWVFFFKFPDYGGTDAASEYVALALTPDGLRYFTLETSRNVMNNERQWVFGEFYYRNGNRAHRNYGPVDNDRPSWFGGLVINLLDQQNL